MRKLAREFSPVISNRAGHPFPVDPCEAGPVPVGPSDQEIHSHRGDPNKIRES